MRRQLQLHLDEPSGCGEVAVFSAELQQQLVNLMADAIVAVVLPERSQRDDAAEDQRQD